MIKKQSKADLQREDRYQLSLNYFKKKNKII